MLPNSSIYKHCPAVMDAFRDMGAEVVGHGRTNSEAQGGMTEALETELIDDAIA